MPGSENSAAAWQQLKNQAEFLLPGMTKITEKQLIDKLTQLKRVKPDKNWVIFCRENLILSMGQAKDSQPAKAPFSISFLTWLKHFGSKPFLKPVAVLSVIFIMIFGSGLTILAKAKDSLPGDHLFPVKIALEQARLLAAPSAEDKADVQNDIMAIRLDELNKIINGNDSMESKQPKIEEAITNLQKHLLTVKDELPKFDKSEAKTAVAVAKKIDASASEVEQALGQAKVALSPSMNQVLSDKIADAANEANNASTKALEVMVQNQTEPGSDISAEEILAKLDEKIQKTQEKIKGVEDAVNNSAIKNEFPINAVIILDQSDKAKEVLDQARESLKQNDISGTLQTVKIASEMANSAEKMIGTVAASNTETPALSSPSGGQDTANQGTSATSTTSNSTSSEATH